MMLLKIVAVGRVRERSLAERCAEYRKRLGAYAKVQLVEVADGTVAVSVRDRSKGNGKYYVKDVVQTPAEFLARIQKEIDEKA